MNKTPEISIIFELFLVHAFMLVPYRQLVLGERGTLGLGAKVWPFYRPNFEILPENESLGRGKSFPLRPGKSGRFGRKTEINQYVSNILLYILTMFADLNNIDVFYKGILFDIRFFSFIRIK